MSQRLSDLIDRLQRAGLEVDAEDLADILWLAQQIQAAGDLPSESIAPEPEPLEINPRQPQPKPKKKSSESLDSEPSAEVTLPPSVDSQPSTDQPSQSTPNRSNGLPFWAPAAPALRQVRQLERALRPLARKVNSHHAYELDEAATVEQSADLKCWLPVLRPARERWLDVALVVEKSPAIDLWRSLVDDWQALLGRSGAFRDVRVWWLREESGQIAISPHPNGPVSSPRQLLDPSGRRLILFMSDCTSGLWRSNPTMDDHSSNDWPANSLQAVLKLWAAKGALTLVQWLPEWLWRRTALGAAYWVQLSATMPGQASDRLVVSGLPVWEEVETAGALRLPVVTIEPGPLARWARLVAGAGDALSAGVLFEPGTVWQPPMADPNDRPDPEMIVRQFWAVASPLAKQLAGYMAAVPVSWEVLHLIQADPYLLPQSNQVHGAEVFMGGLMERVGDRYDFREGVRSWLVDSMPRSQTEKVLNAVSDQIAKRFGMTARGFRALLFDSADLPEGAIAGVQAFARITRSTLLRMGGEFAALGDRLDPAAVGIASPPPPDKGLKPLVPTTDAEQADAEQTYPDGYIDVFEKGFLPSPEDLPEVSQEAVEPIAFAQQQMQSQEISSQDLRPEPPQVQTLPLEPFSFETAILVRSRRDSILSFVTGNTDSPKLKIERSRRQAQQVIERLPKALPLEMVLIPGGTFSMGAPEEEKEPESFDDERPQHPVTVPPFLIGKYPITQAQWRAIAALPKVNIDLNPNPSKFTENEQGDRAENRPVERVSWHEATEACDRLAQATGRPYSLPSEAQWEYACRAGTTTPFYFGETITPELANYDGNYTYANGPKGAYRQRTTAVGSFPANAWGLYDMHGNVWEWCADLWHSNYQGAPTDGSAWITDPARNSRLLRGGSWYALPRSCRSAVRFNVSPDDRGDGIGFRLCCAVARTPEVDVEE